MRTSQEASRVERENMVEARAANLDEFRTQFPIKPMNETAFRYKNDCVLVNDNDILIKIEFPVGREVQVTNVTADGDVDFTSGRYLWVVRDIDGVHALEVSGAKYEVGGGKLKHSNLTGGGPAHGGGEMWYWKDASTILVNAHSGRYGIRDSGGVEMAQALVKALRECGFKAATTGIEEGTDFLRAYPDPDAILEF